MRGDIFMKFTLMRFSVAAFAIGMMLPQPAPAEKGYHLGDVDRQARRRGFGYDPDKMIFDLGLNRSQRGQAFGILDATRARTKPIEAKLHENGEALHAAYDAHDYGRIKELTHKQKALMENMIVAYYDAKIQFYRILTPEQRVKADRLNIKYRRHIESRSRPHGLGA